MASRTRSLELELAKLMAKAYDRSWSWEHLSNETKTRWLRTAKAVILLYLTPQSKDNTPT